MLIATVIATLLLAEAIEPLRQPPYASPPRSLGEEETRAEDLERKRTQRRRREPRPATESATKKRDKQLLAETLAAQPPIFLLELALVAGTVVNSGEKEGYTMDPTVHVNAFWRKRPNPRDDGLQPFVGARLAPFVGTGFYEKRPGSYGITYFGPMVGVGRLGLLPQDAPRDPDAAIPSAQGWLVSLGLSAATMVGRQAPREEGQGDGGADNDFVDRKVTFDVPGFSLEARYLKLLFGLVGLDAVLGVQKGRDRTFVYAGIGAAGYR